MEVVTKYRLDMWKNNFWGVVLFVEVQKFIVKFEFTFLDRGKSEIKIGLWK